MRKKRKRNIGLPDQSKIRPAMVGAAFFIPLPLSLFVSGLVKLPPAIGPVPVVLCAIGLALCVSAMFWEKARRLRFAFGFYLAMTFCIPLTLFLYWPRAWFVTGVLGGQVLGGVIWFCCLMLSLGKLDPFGNVRNVGDAELRNAILSIAAHFLLWNVLVTLFGGTPCTSGGRCRTGEALFGTQEALFSSYWICCILCTVCVAVLPRLAFEHVSRLARHHGRK
ncbi:hypothetical protein [Rhizobium sp. BK176]|uniref:hypothetical protein n=1 Tax=Rhizobium sp. BK176 TaxID=2587071 RepID=UPI00216A8F83|nr:hypothetical protein [Rhizobium sp. BK176]MCS4091839.1 hypothetical protein [Rhizobium sp. BK176]